MSQFQGHFTAYDKETGEVFWAQHNVELLIGGWLISWVMASKAISTGSAGGDAIIQVPDYPIWGWPLAQGAPHQILMIPASYASAWPLKFTVKPVVTSTF